MTYTITQTRNGFQAVDAERGIELFSPTREELHQMIAKVEGLGKSVAPAPTDGEIASDSLRARQAESPTACDAAFRHWTGRSARHYRVSLNDLSPHQVPADTVRRKHDLDSIQIRFERFHAANPHIYERLVEAARRLKAASKTKIGISHLVEDCIRWAEARTTGENWKISNDYRSRYARLIMEENPDLAGIFEVRQLESA